MSAEDIVRMEDIVDLARILSDNMDKPTIPPDMFDMFRDGMYQYPLSYNVPGEYICLRIGRDSRDGNYIRLWFCWPDGNEQLIARIYRGIVPLRQPGV